MNKTFDEMYKELEEKSMCLNSEKLNSYKYFAFLHDAYCESASDSFCYMILTDPPVFSIFTFELKNGYIVGHIIDYIRFKWRIRTIKKYIKNYNKKYSNNISIEKKVLVEISKRELNMMKNRFKIIF